MEAGFSVAPAELDATATILAEVSGRIEASARLLRSQAPEAGSSRDETLAALAHLVDGTHRLAGLVASHADAVRASSAAYAHTDLATDHSMTAR